MYYQYYYPGFGGYPVYENNESSINWIWIIVIVFILLFLFRGFSSCNDDRNHERHHRCNCCS